MRGWGIALLDVCLGGGLWGSVGNWCGGTIGINMRVGKWCFA